MRAVFSRGRFARGSWLAIAAVLLALVGGALRAEISEADKKKRDAFLKAREEMHTIAKPTPAKKSSGKPKATSKKKKKSASGKATPAPKRSATSDEDDEEKATPIPRASAAEPRETPARAQPAPTSPPANTPRISASLPSDITIQKSGIEEERGFEPPPPPPPKRSFWARIFGGREETRYRYLSRSVIDAIRRAPVQRSRWKFIIVHNSGTRQGNARAFDYYHRKVRRMQNGMAYHFVVGNGTSSGDGQVEVGDRWRRQINGGHVHSDYLNNISLGICLVGDFNKQQPTRAQLASSEELIRYLRERCGGSMPVRPHREMNPPRWATDCPGDAFPYGWFRRF